MKTIEQVKEYLKDRIEESKVQPNSGYQRRWMKSRITELIAILDFIDSSENENG